uniref:Amino acid transporter transmembrane domain-containing protein n=1 Tax=Acrobeloides nanus TaxID=290746 RepID=A0A914ENY2_9BILA
MSETCELNEMSKEVSDGLDVTAKIKLKGTMYGKANGLSWFTTALFIVADMAGGGVVAIPIAMLQSGGFAGGIVITIICVAFCYTAHILGENWVTMCERWPEYREHCRKPYPEMAYRSMGPTARRLTSLTLNVMLFGVSVVYLLLSSKIINDFVTTLTGVNMGFCVMLLLVAGVLLPVTWLKSPQDFWAAVVVAMLTTAISVILILIGTIQDNPTCAPVAQIPDFEWSSLLLSLGTFMFAFGGHGVFPTIQHDMKNPKQFTRASITAFFIVAAMYVPITVLGYITYGNSLQDSIINSVQNANIQQAANLFIAVHCILTLTIVINPLNQELEHALRTPHKFGFQRVLLRTTVMAIIVFMAESVPNFGPILNLIGGTTVALTSAIMPCLFSLFLQARDKMDGKDSERNWTEEFKRVIKKTSLWRLWINIFVIVIAIICGVTTTYTAILDMGGSRFSRPCYLRAFVDTNVELEVLRENPMHCCGPHFNVSRFGSASEFCV